MTDVLRSTNLTATLPNGTTITGVVEYSPTTGNSKVKVRGLFGSTIGTRDIMVNGQWTTWAEENMSTQDKSSWFPTIQQTINNAYTAAGGNANGNVLPQWTQFPEGATNTQIIPAVDIEVGDTTSGDSNSNIEFKRTDITSDLIKSLMQHGPLQYPTDALYKNTSTGYNQDHVKITQYTYQAPGAATFGGKLFGDEGGDSKSTGAGVLQSGVTRTTPLERYLGMVKLPMPTDISDSNNVSWGQDSINNLSAAFTSAVTNNPITMAGTVAGGAALGSAANHWLGIGNAQGGAFAGMLAGLGVTGADGLKNLSGGASGALIKGTLASRVLAAGGIEVSPESILARGAGVIPNANMELLFNAPSLREFSFAWKMTPRDANEAKKIRHIIRFFKQGMAVRKLAGKGGSVSAGGPSLFLGTPNVFHVQYKTNNDENIEGVNRIKTVACTGCSINYTPDGVWSAYEKGQPVSTIMSLRFQELEPVYDTDYSTSIAEGRKFKEISDSDSINLSGTEGSFGDLYPIGRDEVGY